MKAPLYKTAVEKSRFPTKGEEIYLGRQNDVD